MATRIRDLISEDAVDRIREEFDDLRDRVMRSLPRERARRAKRDRFLAFLGGVVAGAAAAYLLDPRMGRTRRSRLADQAAARGRDAAQTLERQGRFVASTVVGKADAARLRTEDHRAPNDVTLARKVESEILGRPDVPKGSIVVNAERGVVALRGEAPDDETREDVERLVRKVEGVRDVDNLLHLPGESAPNKASARRFG